MPKGFEIKMPGLRTQVLIYCHGTLGETLTLSALVTHQKCDGEAGKWSLLLPSHV
jgi:hypothetical protein